MLKLYNSLTQKIEEVTFIENGKATLYVCGITPYDTTHLGHAFTYLSFDTLIRILEKENIKVAYTQNVTDINDRDNDILKRAKEQNTTWEKLSDFWTKRFLDDMKTLNWRKPDNYIKASENIQSMIAIIERIIDNGFGYIVKGNVYLDINKASDFGKLSRLNKDEMLKIADNFEEDTKNLDKKNPLDITLWKATLENQPNHIPSFNSPWGNGRPGWHIECSAMGMTTLGEQIDIHGGGIDLIYPHHESEITQSECATNKKPFSRFWIHTASVYMNKEKMSKSLGNLILIYDLLKKYSPNAIRFVLLSHHYRKSWEYSENEFIEAEKTIKEIKEKLPLLPKENTKIQEEIDNLLNNDLQIPQALKLIYNLVLKNEISTNEVKTNLELLGFIF